MPPKELTPEQVEELKQEAAKALEEFAELTKTQKEATKALEEYKKPAPDSMPIPPQVKYGIALMEMDDGSVVRVPINPHDINVTYGKMLRLVMGEVEDIRAEILAMKIRKFAQPEPPLPGSGLGL